MRIFRGDAMVTFIGIDPGLQGGIARISESNEIVTRVLPTVIKGTKRIFDHFTLAHVFCTFESTSLDPTKFFVALEEQHSMPKQGVVSTCSICYGFGALKQCLVDFSIPHEVTPPKDWQKEFGISGRKGDTKAQALRICRDLFPGANLLATERSKKPHAGIVDAVLIAEYARRKHEGITKK